VEKEEEKRKEETEKKIIEKWGDRANRTEKLEK